MFKSKTYVDQIIIEGNMSLRYSRNVVKEMKSVL